MQKLLILGLDALEYNIVTRFRFKTLLQRDFGKIDLTPYKNKLITPWLWSIIISGHIDTGITHFVTYESKLIRFVAKILTSPALYKKVERLIEKIRRRRGQKIGTAYILHRRGIKVRPMGKQDLKVPTIFELIPNSRAICIPGYNLWKHQFLLDLYLPLTRCIGDPEMTRKRLRLQWLLEKKKMRILEDMIKSNDWNLIMVHFYITDVVGHLYWNKPIMLLETYRIVSRWINKIKRILASKNNEPVWILIISDHGMRRGVHTDHAFWSSNYPLKKKPKKLTDYFKLIIRYFERPEDIITF